MKQILSILAVVIFTISLFPGPSASATPVQMDYHDPMTAVGDADTNNAYTNLQTITATSTYLASSIALKVSDSGIDTGNMTISVYATSGGAKTGSALAYGYILASQTSTYPTRVYIPAVLNTPVWFTSGTMYAVEMTSSIADPNSIKVHYSHTTNYYTGGIGYINGENSNNKDFGFKIYTGDTGFSYPITVVTGTAYVTSGTTVRTDNYLGTSGINATTRGIQYGTSTGNYTANVTENGSYSGESFSTNLTGLSAGQTYYYRAAAYEASNGWVYGSELTFTMTAAATVTTLSATWEEGDGRLVLNGQVNDAGGSNITSRGFQIGTTSGAYNSIPIFQYGNFTAGYYSLNVHYAQPGVTYYYRVMVTNSSGASYGDELSVTTGSTSAPTVTTISGGFTSASSIGLIGYTSGVITARGFQIADTEQELTDNDPDSLATDINWSIPGSFQVTGYISPAPGNIWVRAYATYSSGTVYGDILEVDRIDIYNGTPVVEAVTILLTSVSPTLYGNISSTGGITINSYGFEWGNAPTNLNNSWLLPYSSINGTAFDHQIPAQTVNSTLYWRALLLTENGVFYSSTQDDLITGSLPWTTTGYHTWVSSTSVTIHAGAGPGPDGSPVVLRGIRFGYARGSYPYSGTETGNWTTSTSFEMTIEGLTTNADIYYQVIAQNAIGNWDFSEEVHIIVTGTEVIEGPDISDDIIVPITDSIDATLSLVGMNNGPGQTLAAFLIIAFAWFYFRKKKPLNIIMPVVAFAAMFAIGWLDIWLIIVGAALIGAILYFTVGRRSTANA